MSAAPHVQPFAPLEAYADDREAAGTAATRPGVAPSPQKPFIRLEAGQLHGYAAASERLLSDEVFVRAGRLVRIGLSRELPAATGPSLCRDDRQAVVLAVTVEWLRRRLTELAVFQVYRRREGAWASVDCPKALAENILQAAAWEHFRPLTAVASAPFIRRDLTLCEVPGYDGATGVYLRPSQAFPRVPDRPTRAHGAAALALLLRPFGELPFDGPVSRAVFAAHVVTAVARVAFDTCPVFFFTAAMPRVGKTLGARMAPLIATGTEPAMRPYAEEADEVRKVLLSALLAGDPSVIFDNAANGVRIRSPALCGFVTAGHYTDRRLGSSDSIALPNRTIVTITGNNVTPCGDLARRSLICRLDVNAESARGRKFKIADLPRHVAERRPELLVAALTIVRAYIAAGQPFVGSPLESFESWSRLVRAPLMWLDCADPVASQESEADEEVDAVRGAFIALGAVYPGGAEFTARDVATQPGVLRQDIRQSLEVAGCSDASDPARVGYWLRAARGKVAGDRKLITRRKSGGGTPLWQLAPI